MREKILLFFFLYIMLFNIIEWREMKTTFCYLVLQVKVKEKKIDNSCNNYIGHNLFPLQGFLLTPKDN